MSVYLHRLEGCTPRPLASYLKALGVLRLVSTQADPSARGRWHKERFELITTLNQEELSAFFLERYQPSPILSPWNGSAFTGGNPHITRFEASQAGRFEPFRVALKQARASLASIGHDQGQLSKKDYQKQKPTLLAQCKRTWRGAHEAWLEVCYLLNTQGEPSYPALLGTGGNDGRLDFTLNQMQRLAELFDLTTGEPLPSSAQKLSAALWASKEPVLESNAIGMYHPGAAGGVNSSTNFEEDSKRLNSFDFVLMMEGTLLFRVGLTRQLNSTLYGNLSAPFCTRITSSGYSTASSQEGGARGEQWFPLWTAPVRFDELMQLLSEGRASLHRQSATQSTDLARSIASLGVRRGLSAFERFSYLERNGQAHFITPVGRFEVQARPQSRLLDDLDAFDWLSKLRRVKSEDRVPQTLVTLILSLEAAIFEVCAKANEPALWQRLLVCLDQIERALIKSERFCKEKNLQPIPPLSAGWVVASCDESPEHRLALTLALSSSPLHNTTQRDHVRRHWLPLKETGRFNTTESGFARTPSVVCHAQDPLNDLTALLERRVLESAQQGLSRLTLQAHPHAPALYQDLEGLFLGEVNLEHTLALARPLMTLKRGSELNERLSEVITEALKGQVKAYEVDVRFALLRLVTSPYLLEVGDGSLGVRFDPEVLRRLAAGDIERAMSVTLRRLRASGFRAPLSLATGEPELARRLLAALAFPPSVKDLSQLARAHLN